ncbi:MAG: DMT family transporter [Clostridiales bacterium]|nr:DMT family transporter [Clostridiales bacterium]
MNETVMRRLAKPMLLAAALIWGSSFFMMKGAVDVLPTFYLLAIRFTGGAVLLSLVCWKKWRFFTRDYLWRGAVIGFCLWAAYSVQTFGIMWTTPSNNAFLTAVYCVLVPFFYWAVMKRKPDRYNILAAVLCVAGVGLVSISGGFHMALGDLLTLIGAVFYALHIVAVAKVSPGKDIYLLTVFQFAFAALYAWIGGLLFQEFPGLSVFSRDMMIQLAYLTVMCTTVALLFQNVGQVWSDPASAAILLSLESVFGVIFSVICYGDPVTPRLVAGFTLIFVAVVCSETKFSFLRRKSIPKEAEV